MKCIRMTLPASMKILNNLDKDHDKLQLHSMVFKQLLTLKAPILTVADDIHKYFFIAFS